MDKLFYDRISPEDVAEAILSRVKDEKVRVSVTWEPGHTELSVEPWEPFEMECPYGKK